MTRSSLQHSNHNKKLIKVKLSQKQQQIPAQLQLVPRLNRSNSSHSNLKQSRNLHRHFSRTLRPSKWLKWALCNLQWEPRWVPRWCSLNRSRLRTWPNNAPHRCLVSTHRRWCRTWSPTQRTTFSNYWTSKSNCKPRSPFCPLKDIRKTRCTNTSSFRRWSPKGILWWMYNEP